MEARMEARKRRRKVNLGKFKARKLHERLESAFEGYSLAALGDLNIWKTLPDPVRSGHRYAYMGRQLTVDFCRFISLIGEERGFEKIETGGGHSLVGYSESQSVGILSGVPGYGKSTSLKTAYGYLRFVFSRLEKQAVETGADEGGAGETSDTNGGTRGEPSRAGDTSRAEEGRVDETSSAGEADKTNGETSTPGEPSRADEMSGQVAAGETLRTRKRKRIMYLDGARYVDDPAKALMSALLVSHYDLVEAQDVDIMELQADPTYDQISCFLAAGEDEEEVYIVLDDGNLMDPNDDENTSSERKFLKVEREDAWRKLTGLAETCAVVVCVSVKSWLLQQCGTDKGATYRFFGGGFTASERSAYLKHIGKTLSREELDITGSVPRLIKQYFNSPRKLEDSYTWYQQGIRKYIDANVERDGDAIFDILSGTVKVLEKFDGLETRCFFQGRAEKAECLTNHLKSYAIGYLVSQLKRVAHRDAILEIKKWLATIDEDTNICRIGWNSEAAAIMAFSLLPVRVDLSAITGAPAIGAEEEPQQEPTRKDIDRERCGEILKLLRRDRRSWLFAQPVAQLWPAVAKAFQGVIKCPMDLGTVRRKLRSGSYATTKEFVSDVRLIFQNAKSFNQEGSQFYVDAVDLLDKFECLCLQKVEAEKLQKPDILEIKPVSVQHFRGKFTWDMLDKKKRTLLIPYAFNNLGADMYYEDEDMVVIIQVSVGRNARKYHKRTIELMQSCPATEKRRKIVLWVLAGVGWAHNNDQGYEEVQVPFQSIFYELGCIDARCALLRESPEEGCLYCGRVQCPVQAEGNEDTWLQCDSCLYWVHRMCLSPEERSLDPLLCTYCMEAA